MIVGGGDTRADCLGTAVREGAASITQLEKVYRLSPAYEKAGKLRTAPAADADARLFAASTLGFTGDAAGRGSALHLTGADADRRARPGTTRELPAEELVLLTLGFTGPEPTAGGLIAQLGLDVEDRGALARGADFATNVPGVFATGDAARGQSLVVWAMAEGRAAAATVDRRLTGATELAAPISPYDHPMATR